MSQVNRYWQKNHERSEVLQARRALEGFRDKTSLSGFPTLRQYLWWRNIGLRYHDLSLDQYSPYYAPELVEEEYTRFKVAYMATEAGAQDDWASKHEHEPFW